MSVPYTVIRRPRRRTASITVAPDSTVSVIVPAHLSDKEVAEIVARKRRWIQGKISFNREVRHPYKAKEYVSGEAFSYVGRNYRLRVESGAECGVELKNGRLYVHVPAGLSGRERDRRIVDQLTGWYKDRALEKIRQRVRFHAKQMGLTWGAVGIKDYQRQWGSCYQDKSLFFNWRVIMAPLRIVDYVVVHELCHLRHHDHSKEFWKLLRLYLPDYLDRKEWLRVNGGLLVV